METGLILSFLGAAILLSLMPGPDNIFVLTESITKGHRNGVAISVGLCLGILIHTLAAATGLSLIIQQSALAFSVIKYAGAAYLFYLAWGASRSQQPVLNFEEQAPATRSPLLPLIGKGFIMNVTNPKVSLFFIAFLPQFVSVNGFHVAIQMIILGLLFMAQALLVFSLIAILSGRLRPYVNHPRFWRITKWSTVGILSLLGLTLALSER